MVVLYLLLCMQIRLISSSSRKKYAVRSFSVLDGQISVYLSEVCTCMEEKGY